MFFICMTETFHDPEEDKSVLIERCLRRIARGHKDAIGDIYELTKAAVYGYILSILKNAEDAEDILQETIPRANRWLGFLPLPGIWR